MSSARVSSLFFNTLNYYCNRQCAFYTLEADWEIVNVIINFNCNRCAIIIATGVQAIH